MTGFNIERLTEKVVPLTIDLPEELIEGGGQVNVAYRPAEYTPKVEERSKTFGQSSASWAALLGNGLLVSWDVVMNGEPVGVDEESLMVLPGLFLQHIGLEIARAMRPNPKSGGNSALISSLGG
jgi:hypothetical protein